jgi:hypothetical protein
MAQTNLEKFASIAEIVGGIAVIVTLVLVVLEIRANTDATRALSRQSIAARAEELLLQETRPELAVVIIKARNGELLEGVERSMYSGYFNARLRNAEEAFLQYRDGQLSEEYWLTRSSAAARTLRDPLAQEIWRAALRDTGLYTAEFSRWVDQTMEPSPRE